MLEHGLMIISPWHRPVQNDDSQVSSFPQAVMSDTAGLSDVYPT
jgi:hypothetical protein